MARCIDADKLKEHIESFAGMFTDEGFMIDYHAVLNAIDNAPTADVAEVCRCEDCRYSRKDPLLADMYGCTMYRDMRKGSDFCNYGERKAQE